jgi:hypothetical protein
MAFVSERFADVNVVNRVPHGGGGVIWAGISYGPQTQLHFIDGNLNALRYRDEILRPIQHDNNGTRICTQFMQAENVTDMSPPIELELSDISN